MSLSSITAPVLMALGKVNRLFQFALAGQVLMVCLFLLFARFGAQGIAAGLVLSALVTEVCAFLCAARSLDLPPLQAAAPIARVTVAALLMGAVVMGTASVLAASPDWTRLAVCVAIGVGSYLAALVTLNRADLRDSIAGFRSVLAAR